jgi:general secretion pathway protein H
MGRARPEIGRRGFTLLELVVTLLILALAIGLAGPMIGRSTQSIRARAEVARFSALLRHTREQAITSRQPHSLVVDPAAHRVSIVAGDDEVRETRALPEALAVEADPPPALTVRFEPQGVSSGGNFRLTSGAIRYRVRVDGLTGRVKAERE